MTALLRPTGSTAPKLIGTLLLGTASSLIAYLVTLSVKVGLISCLVLLTGSYIYFCVRSWWVRITSISQNGIVRVFDKQEQAVKAMQETAATTTMIDVWSVRGLGILALRDSVLKKCILQRSGSIHIRILLLSPDSHFAEARAREIREDARSFKHGIQLGVTAVQEMALQSRIPVEIRLFDSQPVWRIVMFDGCMFVSQYLEDSEGHETPVYELSAAYPRSLFFGFRRAFNAAWDKAAPVSHQHRETSRGFLD